MLLIIIEIEKKVIHSNCLYNRKSCNCNFPELYSGFSLSVSVLMILKISLKTVSKEIKKAVAFPYTGSSQLKITIDPKFPFLSRAVK